MPVIRLHKKDPETVVNSNDFMDLTYIDFDGDVYMWDWTGRGGILPIEAIKKCINSASRTRDLRQVIIACDGAEWVATDRVNILTNVHKNPRLAGIELSHALILASVASPSDWVAFQIASKTSEYWIEVILNPLSEGEYGFPEIPKP